MISKEKLVEIIKSTPTRPGGYAEYSDIAGRILLALDQERKGEVVLGRGCANNICSMCGNPFRSSLYHGKCESVRGKVGQLIFRKQEGK